MQALKSAHNLAPNSHIVSRKFVTMLLVLCNEQLTGGEKARGDWPNPPFRPHGCMVSGFAERPIWGCDMWDKCYKV